MTRTITRARYLNYHPLCGRHVHHDSESRRYEYPTEGLSIVSAKHTRRIPVLDQGQLGSCCGNAGIGCLGTDPYFDSLKVRGEHADDLDRAGAWVYSLDEPGAVKLYSDATATDGYPGQYPPDDTGSDGLTIAKVLKAAGEISGYQHTFSADAALKALGQTPVIVGTEWTETMFQPDPDGRLHPTGPIAGGHEYVVDEIDAQSERVWLTNSWGKDWSLAGRAYLTFDDFGYLLGRQGDVTVFVPLTQPPPKPTGHWRVGRSLGRTIYLDNHFQGVLETRELATEVVSLLNGQP